MPDIIGNDWTDLILTVYGNTDQAKKMLSWRFHDSKRLRAINRHELWKFHCPNCLGWHYFWKLKRMRWEYLSCIEVLWSKRFVRTVYSIRRAKIPISRIHYTVPVSDPEKEPYKITFAPEELDNGEPLGYEVTQWESELPGFQSKRKLS